MPAVTLKLSSGTAALVLYVEPVIFLQSLQWQRSYERGMNMCSSRLLGDRGGERERDVLS